MTAHMCIIHADSCPQNRFENNLNKTDTWKTEKHSPTVIDSGRPDVGSVLVIGADCVGGLDSMLKRMSTANFKPLSSFTIYFLKLKLQVKAWCLVLLV